MRKLDPQSLGEHLDRLYRAAWALCGSREDAEDLVQDTYARVLARPRHMRGESDLAYLMQVLRNTFLTSRRTASRRPRVAATLDDFEFADPRRGSRPEDAVATSEVFAAIADLPEPFRLALIAVDVVGLSYREAGRALDTPEATVTTRLYRARQQVMRTLTQSDPEAHPQPGESRRTNPRRSMAGSGASRRPAGTGMPTRGKEHPTEGVMTEMDRFAFDNDRDGSPGDSPTAGSSEPTRGEMQTLAALADGTLRSSELRAELEADPASHALLQEQSRAVALVRDAAADVLAPDSLRERVKTIVPEAARADGTARGSRRAPRRSSTSRRPRLLAGLAAVAAAVLVAVALSASGTSGGPTVAQAAALATRPSTLPAPRHAGAHSYLVDRTAAGVPFPYWEDRFHWRTVGARTDAVAGRSVTTVFYVDRHARRLAYAIVSGAPLPWPSGAQTVVRNGVHMAVVNGAGTSIVTWERAGHSCVLAATGVPTRTLVRLASWRGNGSIPY